MTVLAIIMLGQSLRLQYHILSCYLCSLESLSPQTSVCLDAKAQQLPPGAVIHDAGVGSRLCADLLNRRCPGHGEACLPRESIMFQYSVQCAAEGWQIEGLALPDCRFERPECQNSVCCMAELFWTLCIDAPGASDRNPNLRL